MVCVIWKLVINHEPCLPKNPLQIAIQFIFHFFSPRKACKFYKFYQVSMVTQPLNSILTNDIPFQCIQVLKRETWNNWHDIKLKNVCLIINNDLIINTLIDVNWISHHANCYQFVNVNIIDLTMSHEQTLYNGMECCEASLWFIIEHIHCP